LVGALGASVLGLLAGAVMLVVPPMVLVPPVTWLCTGLWDHCTL